MLTLSHYLTGCFPITKDCNIGKLSGQTQEEKICMLETGALLKCEYFNLNFSDKQLLISFSESDSSAITHSIIIF